MKVLALASYPERMAATRFRVARYGPYLASRGIHVELVSWLDDDAAARLYVAGGVASRGVSALRGVARQLAAVANRWDVVLVQREAVLAGPPLIEAIVWARQMPLIVDYDDAIWIAQGSALKRVAKCAWKFDWVLRHATHAIAGSHTLSKRAMAAGIPCTVLPTVVERSVWTPKRESPPDPSRALVIGWVGTHSTAPQLELVAPALRRLRQEGFAFRVVVIGAAPEFRLDGVEIEVRPWALESEVEDLRSMDIGVVPMWRSEWHEGKSAFKQVQLMAVGVPFVSSMVGGARDFVKHEENALVAESEEDWYEQLRRLLEDPALRSRLAQSGRNLVETRLCIEEQAETLASILASSVTTGSFRAKQSSI